MSILSTAVLTASLVSAAGIGNLQQAPVPVQNSIQKESVSTIQNNSRLQRLMEQCGISEQTLNSLLSGQCVIIRPDCGPNNPGSDTPDNGNGGSGSDTNKPNGGGSIEDNEGSDSETDDVNSSYAAQVITLVNEERAKYNLAPLTTEENISAAALTRAKEIVTSFSHTRPDGTSFSTVLKEHGVSYKMSGENIAWGQSTPEEVVKGWMNSPGHRANILKEQFTSIGVGFYTENGRNYWTQLFT